MSPRGLVNLGVKMKVTDAALLSLGSCKATLNTYLEEFFPLSLCAWVEFYGGLMPWANWLSTPHRPTHVLTPSARGILGVISQVGGVSGQSWPEPLSKAWWEGPVCLKGLSRAQSAKLPGDGLMTSALISYWCRPVNGQQSWPGFFMIDVTNRCHSKDAIALSSQT